MNSNSGLHDPYQIWLRFQCVVVRDTRGSLEALSAGELPAPHSQVPSHPSGGLMELRPLAREHWFRGGHPS